MIMCKTSKEIGGMGHSLKRKEDARFIRGLGKYTDDVQLPGMLYMDIARSPFAYAKIKSIDKSVAMEIPEYWLSSLGKISTVQPSLDANPDVRHSDGLTH